jgi:hypothetical protein
VVAVTLLVASLVAASAASATDPTFTTNPYFNCRGDHIIGVPDGNRLVLRIGYTAKNAGLAQDFLQTFDDFAVTIDGVAIADPMQYWGAPERSGDIWITRWVYDTGITVTFANPFWLEITSSAAHRLLDGLTREEETNQPTFAEAGQSLIDTDDPCLVSAF